MGNCKVTAIIVFAILALLALTPWHAYGSSQMLCEDIFRSSPFMFEVVERDDLITDAQVSEIKDVIDRTAVMVHPYFKLPPTLELHVEASGNQAAGGLNKVAVPYHYGPKSPRHTHAVIAHEFGHVVFYANANPAFSLFVTNLRSFYESTINQRDVQYAQLRRDQITYRKEHDNQASPEIAKAISDLVNEIAVLKQRFPRKITDKELDDFRFAYEELFGDVVSVAMLQNPRAIYSSTFPLVESKIEAQNRDFLKPADANTWNNTQIHQVFTPTRYALSQNPIAVRLFSENPGLLVRIIFDAITMDVQNLATTPEKIYTLTPSERNLRLIETINHLLEKENN